MKRKWGFLMNIMALLNALPGSIAQGLIWGIMAVGVYMTYKVLDFADLTVDGSIATGGATAVMLMLSGQNVYVALIGATIAGMLAGLATGIFHVAFGIPGILAGILTQLGLYSVNMRILGKSNQAISVDNYDLILSLRDIPNAILVGVIFCAVLIVVLYCFYGTEIGRVFRATGCNEIMARAQGTNTDHMKIIGLMISNGVVALAGGLYAQYQGNADVNMGRGAIVIGLAAVIIGEVVLGKLVHFNYMLRMAAVVFGAIMYFCVIAVVLWLGLETTDMKLISALIVAAFLAVPYLKGKYNASHVKRGGGKNA